MQDMSGAGVIFSADTGILRAYCEAEASYVRNIIRLGETGPVIRGARGREVVVNPLARIVREDR
jgi:phage terminase small subunit